MAQFVEATSADGGNRKVFINMDTVAWIQRLSNPDVTRVVFTSIAVGSTSGGVMGGMAERYLDVRVKEQPEELMALARGETAEPADDEPIQVFRA